MAATGASAVKVCRNTRGFMSVLTYAVCEWFLIFLLFIDAVLSYFLTKFASYCDLQTPCILCSRLDHVLGNEKPEFYRTLVCSSHRLEISSLISCQIHGKLADAYSMCENCLLSFAPKNKGILESHMLLGSKLGFDLGGGSFQSPFLNKDLVSGSSGSMHCSCCNKTWSSREYAQRLFQLKSIRSGVSKPNIPLARLPSRNHLNRRDSLKRIRAKFYGSVTSQHLGSNGYDPLSQVGYTELKVTSDSESEVLVSDDDDDGSRVAREKNDYKPDISIQHASEVLLKTACDDSAPVKPNHLYVNIRPSLLEAHMLPSVSESQDVNRLASDVSIGHGLEWQQTNQRFNSSALPELISLDYPPSSSKVVEVHPAALPELISLDDFPPSLNVVEVPVGALPEKYVTGVNGVGHSGPDEGLASISGAASKTDQVLNNLFPPNPDHADSCISSKLAVNNMGREASSFVAEQPMKDPERVKDLKLLQSGIPFSQGSDLSTDNTSPRVQGHDDELDASSSNGVQIIQKSESFDRDESGHESHESLDGSTVSEIDGESVVDRLKRQVDYDRNCMNNLYKELEEERNASAIAANQAMAMINRLQEEKAALHMEALQYLRMMEEQAEYDVEALQKANDLLAEKDTELQDLEAELDFYRNQYADDTAVDSTHEDTCDVKEENIMVENTGTSCIKDASGISSTMVTEALIDNDKPKNGKISLLRFEDEKLYIAECLKKLERKLHPDNGALVDMPNGRCIENIANGLNYHEEILHNEETQIDHPREENGLSTPKVSQVSNGSPLFQGGGIASVGDNQYACQENNHIDSDGQKSAIHPREIDLAGLENEVSDLNHRLEALEADHDFLEHALNSLQNGTEGLQFIQEITHQLQELRKVGLRQRCQSVP